MRWDFCYCIIKKHTFPISISTNDYFLTEYNNLLLSDTLPSTENLGNASQILPTESVKAKA